jgi:YtcA-like protein
MIKKRNSYLVLTARSSLVTGGSLLAGCFLLTACSRAPSVDIIGSFFPVWMVCLTIAVLIVACLRWLLLRLQLESEVGPLALFYPSALVLFTCGLWLIFFR